MTIQQADVVVIGGGPAGLSATLVLGRGMKKVVLCDAGERRNAAATHMHGFVTRDGVPPSEFRRIGREQLRPYDVQVRDVGVHEVQPLEKGGFEVSLVDGAKVLCRRVLLTTGMVDEVPDLPGIRELWGPTVFQCPYCHGWEVRNQRWGMLVMEEEHLEFAAFLTGWTKHVTAFVNGSMVLSAEQRDQLWRAGVTIEERRVHRLVAGPGQRLTAVEFEDGTRIQQEALVVRPPQRQVALVERLGLELDERGYVRVDAHEETSVPGLHAAGDLTSRVQSAVLSAAAGTRAAYAINHVLNRTTA